MTTDAEDELWAIDMVLNQLADKWALRILCAYFPDTAPIRFNELKRRVGGISQKMLSQQLRKLERNGLLERRVLPGRLLGVEYAVTPLGHTLSEPISALYKWAEIHAGDVRAAQAAFQTDA